MAILLLAVCLYPAGAAIAQVDSHYLAAQKLVGMTIDYKSMYQQYMYFGLLPAKERWENNPKTKPYSEVLVGAVKDVLEAVFYDPETQNKFMKTFADLFKAEFTEKEILDMIAFYETETGKKAIQKLPSLMEKGRSIGSKIGEQIARSPKYEQMATMKFQELQQRGLLPKEF